jgi:HEAT repeat protein
MISYKSKHVYLILLCIFMLFSTINAGFASQKKHEELRKQSYKTLAEAFYSNDTYDNYRIQILEVLGKLSDNTGKTYSDQSVDNSSVYKTLKAMLTTVTETLNKSRKNNMPEISIDTDKKVEEILSKGDAAIAYMLTDALNDQDYTVQLYAASAILKVNEKSAAPLFIKMLDSSKSQEQLIALMVLNKLKDKNAVSGIIKIINNPESSEKHRAYALDALQNTDIETARQVCLELMDDPDKAIKYDAITFLIEHKNPQAIEKYRELVQDPDQKTYAISFLPQVVKSLQEDSLELINKAYKDENILVTAHSIASTINLKNREPVKDLLLDALNHQEPAYMFPAFAVLVNTPTPWALQALNNVEFNQREAYSKAVKIILENKQHNLDGLLESYVHRTTSDVKLVVAKFLIDNKRNEDLAAKILNELIKGENNDYKSQAALILADNKMPVNQNIIIDLLDSTNGEYKAKAIIILAQSGNEVVVPILEKSIKDTNDYTKSYGAALLLYNMGHQEHRDILVKFLSQRDAVSISEEFLDKELFKAFLKNENPMVRVNTAQILLEAGEPDTVPVLRKAINDSDVFVRARAAKALGEYGNIEDIEILKKLMDDNYVRVRVNASEAILRILNRQESESRS